MTDAFESPIFVTGVPRSGTSLVAGALGIAGAWTGQTVPGNASNPRGYFEHRMIREKVVKPLLRGAQSDPLGVRRLPALAQLPRVDNLKEICRGYLDAEGYPAGRKWLYKDAKLSLLWPVFAHAFSAAHWVIVRRDRDDILRSCLRTDFMAQHSTDQELWIKWIEQYNLRLEMLLRSENACSEIWPHELIQGDLSALEQLIAKLGLTWEEQSIREFILPAVWHGHAGA